MITEPLVSILTPCHDSSSFIRRLLDSILSQTYGRIEFIAIDNDSQDNTAEIIKSYTKRFEEKGYTLQYFHQQDMGPSTAINNGLKHIKGDYLIMPDSDDWFAVNDCVERMVNKFGELSDEYAIVRCNIQQIDEVTMMPLGTFYDNFPEEDPGHLFEDCLFALHNYIYVNIGNMIKVSAFQKANGGMDIFNAYNIGQGRQMYLPLHYSYKSYTIPEVLVNYLVRAKSISHGDYRKYIIMKGLYAKSEEYIDGILNRISALPETEHRAYKRKFLYQEAVKQSKIAKENRKYLDLWGIYKDLIRYSDNKFSTIRFVSVDFLRTIYHGCIRK